MPNRLINETSPYLLQHAHNPVNWYSWSEEALQKAQEEDKPIFLSIGYSACHWCHVMAHESFENAETAKFLNEHFVPIKVDREERPDLDGIYMNAVVGMTGQGGWPLSIFLTPQGIPFYGGTYFPPIARYNMPSFLEVLFAVQQAWQKDRDRINETGQKITQYLQETSAWGVTKNRQVSPENLKLAAEALIKSYDWKIRGWGPAPLFPHPMTIDFLLKFSARGNENALKVAVDGLKAMSRGGMYDLVGGGFHRYSTDNKWFVPHFEKMLYDNALLSACYLHAYKITGDQDFRKICEATLDFIVREMSDSLGGFYSSLDADSEGKEGKFYTWSYAEIKKILDRPADLEIFCAAFGVTESGNFEGKNIFQRVVNIDQIASRFKLTEEELQVKLDGWLAKLFEERQKRVFPAKDDKVLTFWNSLAIQVFAEAGCYLDRPEYIQIAQKNAEFILHNLHPGSLLLRSWRAGKAQHNAYLEDYGALSLALISLYQSTSATKWFTSAVQITEEMVNNFKDSAGGFFDTRHDDIPLIVRPKDMQDNVTPSGNALAASALLILSAYTDNSIWRKISEDMLGEIQEALVQYPTSFSSWLQAADFAMGPVSQIAMLWPEGDRTPNEFFKEIWKTFQPRTVYAGSTYPPQEDAPGLLKNRPLKNDLTTVYICQGFVCKRPVNDLENFKIQLLASQHG
jgi:uncharacterized protein